VGGGGWVVKVIVGRGGTWLCGGAVRVWACWEVWGECQMGSSLGSVGLVEQEDGIMLFLVE